MRIRALALLFLATAAYAQPWSGIIDPTRATDWTTVGAYRNPNLLPSDAGHPNFRANCTASNVASGYTVVGGITTVTLLAGSSNATTNHNRILAAQAACPNQVILLPAGTYSIDDTCSANDTTTRGAGAESTILVATGAGSCGAVGFAVMGSAGDQSYQGGAGPAGNHIFNFVGTGSDPAGIGTYTQGSTSWIVSGILGLSVAGCVPSTLANCPWVVIDQLSDSSGQADDWTLCGACANQAGSDSSMRPGRSQVQWAQVTAISAQQADGNFVLTVSSPASPSNGLMAPNWRTGKTPQIWWGNMGGQAHGVGLENFTIDITNLGTLAMQAISFDFSYNCWVRGVKFINHAAFQRAFFSAYHSTQITIESSYFFLNRNATSESYGITTQSGQGLLFQNNIFQQVASAWVNASGPGNVFAHNFTIFDYYIGPNNSSPNWRQTSDYASHAVGSYMNLDEGNICISWQADDVEGTNANMTVYRSNCIGIENQNPVKNHPLAPVISYSLERYHNFLNNVMGAPGSFYTAVRGSTDTGTGSAVDTSIYVLGLAAGGSSGTSTDPLAFTTAFFWCNFDTVTQAITCDPTQVPTSAILGAAGLTKYPNAVPASQYNTITGGTMPASFYLNGKPQWWGFPSATASPWPAIGTDVTGGTVAPCTGPYNPQRGTTAAQCQRSVGGGGIATASSNTTAWGGHVYPNPAFNMYINVMAGPPDGSGQPNGTQPTQSNPPTTTPLTGFNPSAYYGPPPALSLSPTSLAFGNQAQGTTSATQSITVTNTLATTLTSFAVSIIGANLGDFAQNNNCGTSLAGNASCTVTVSCTPTATGARSANIQIADSDASSPQFASLSCTGIAAGPVTSYNPTSVTFPNQNLNTTSTSKTITLTNTGNANLVVTSITMNTGTNFAISSTTPSCGGGCTVAANGTVAIQVTFTPTATGNLSDSVKVVSNAPTTPDLVPVSGTGVDPTLPVFVNLTGCGPQNFTGTCTIPTATAGNLLAVVMGAGSQPTITGVTDNQSETYTQAASCRSTNSTTSFADIWYFSNIASGVTTITITPNPNPTNMIAMIYEIKNVNTLDLCGIVNNGASSASPTGGGVTTTHAKEALISIIEPGAAATAVGSPWTFNGNVGGTLAGFGDLVVSSTGTYAPSWTLNSAATFNASTAAFYESTGGSPITSYSVTSIGFAGLQTIQSNSNSLTVQLTNVGNASLTITSITLTGSNPGDFTKNTTCGGSLAISASCTVTVTFTPSAAGSRTASLTFTTNAASSPDNVSLSGTAILEPTSFGGAAVRGIR